MRINIRICKQLPIDNLAGFGDVTYFVRAFTREKGILFRKGILFSLNRDRQINFDF